MQNLISTEFILRESSFIARLQRLQRL